MNVTVPLSVTRLVGFFGSVTVTWQAEPMEATILDFSPQSGTITLANTQQDASIYITIIDDKIPEDMEVGYCPLGNFSCFFCRLLIFFKFNFFEKFFQE